MVYMIGRFDFNKRSENRPIYIWGGGIYGQLCAQALEEMYGYKVVAVIDNRLCKLEWAACPVVSEQVLATIENADVLICACKSFTEIAQRLEVYESRGIKGWSILSLLTTYNTQKADALKKLYGNLSLADYIELYQVESEQKESDTIIFPYFVVFLTSRCSLRCKECGAFVSKYKTPVDYSLTHVKNTLGKVLGSVEKILELELMGGEPFLCPEFPEILDWCLQQEKISAVKIVTNGTIFPKEEIWEILKHPKVKLLVDNYGECSIKLEKLQERSRKENVNCTVQTWSTWYRMEPVREKNLTEEVVKSVYKTCPFRNCIGIWNNKLFHCGTAANMDHLHMTPDFPSDYINLSAYETVDELRDRIRAYLAIDRLQACRFCKLSEMELVGVAEQE